MKIRAKKSLSLLLAFCMIVSLFAGMTVGASADAGELAFTDGKAEITAGGEYVLPAETTGTISVQTTDKVTLKGGYALDADLTETADSYKFSKLTIDCTSTPGARLELVNMGITGPDGASIIDFAGAENTLTITGTNLIEYQPAYGTAGAAIQVPVTAALTINGSGTLYLYKSAAGAGIGGKPGQPNGDITFGDSASADLHIFAKGTKQSALIGAGADTKDGTLPGAVTFVNGVYNLMSVSRGACIGGSAGSGGASAGTNVYFNGGSVNINVDYSGASVGGGGYDSGNDASGGIAHFAGGSVRMYVDKNAANGSTKGYADAPMNEGVNDAAMTAQRVNSEGEKVYKCVVDTKLLKKADSAFVVKVDGKPYYSGGLHNYKYVNESQDKDNQTSISTTPANWRASDDSCLYLYLTGEDHDITINGEKFKASYNTEAAAKPEIYTTTGVFTVAAETTSVWDGKSIDLSWYDPDATKLYISTPAQLAGLAAIVNGIYNTEIDTFAGNTSYIVDNCGYSDGSGPNGQNNSTPDYHYGNDNFAGKTVYLTADIDMGDANYMPIGGQYLMTVNDSKTRVDASFCGVFDGKGHTVTIDCDRHAEKYGDGQSVGLIGLIGVHDNDDSSLRPSGAAVRNVAVYGSIRANRSVGGIVGKIGKSDGGVTIENCANFASITGTDSKGTGGICGAAWNGGEIRNCYNAGDVTNTGKDAVAGIAGSNEVDLLNCYNVGAVTGPTGSTTASIASENGGGTYTNCYWLAGTADMGVYNKTSDQIVEKTADEMKAANFVALLNGENGTAFAADSKKVNKGYPILSWQKSGEDTMTYEAKIVLSPEDKGSIVRVFTKSDPNRELDTSLNSPDRNTDFEQNKKASLQEGDTVGVIVKAIDQTSEYVAQVTVMTASGKTVDVTLTNQGARMLAVFTMPAEAVTINCVIAQKQSVTVTLGDGEAPLSGMATLPLSINGLGNLQVSEISVKLGSSNKSWNYKDAKLNPTQENAGVTMENSISASNTLVFKAKTGTFFQDGVLASVAMQTNTRSSDDTISLGNCTLKDAEGNTISDLHIICGSTKLTINKDHLYTIAINSTEHGTVTADVSAASKDGAVNFTVAPDAGYALSALTYTSEWGGTRVTKIYNNKLSMPGDNITVTPEFSQEHTVTVDNTKSTNGSVSLKQTTYVKGNTVYATVASNDGYIFDKLHYSYKDLETGEVKEESTESDYLTMPDADITLWVECAHAYTITTEVTQGEGKVAAEKTQVKEGAKTRIAVTPAEKYTLNKVEYSTNGNTWIEMEEGNTNRDTHYYYLTQPASNVTVRVSFLTYPTITSEETEHGSIKLGYSGSQRPQMTVPVYVIPDEGYYLASLYYTLGDSEEKIPFVGGFITPDTGVVTVHGTFAKEEDMNTVTIETANALVEYANKVNADPASSVGQIVKLSKDIDLSSTEWPQIQEFYGVFDGGNNSIIMSGDKSLFSTVKYGVVRNTTVCGSLTASSALVKTLENATVLNCINKATVTAATASGMIDTLNSGGKIIGCHNYGAITATKSNAAGIVQQSINLNTALGELQIVNCSNAGVVQGAAGVAGGIVADVGRNELLISSCRNSGEVSTKIPDSTEFGSSAAGGIAGECNTNMGGKVIIQNCYNTGDITADSRGIKQDTEPGVGGIIAIRRSTVAGQLKNNKMMITNCYNSGTLTKGGQDDFHRNTETAYGEIAPEYINLGNNYAGYKKTSTTSGALADLLTMTNCYTKEQVTAEGFAADSLGEAFKDDTNGINGGTPLLTWERGEVSEIATITFKVTPVNASFALKDENGTIISPVSSQDGEYVFDLYAGRLYSYTVSARGYTSVSDQITPTQASTISIKLTATGGSGGGGHSGSGNVKASVWDGKSIDLSWYDPDETKLYISTPAQLAGLAAIVNGIYNTEIDTFAGNTSYIVDNRGYSDGSGPNGQNNSTPDYHYGNDNFAGKTVYLTADIDMGDANYMPIGGQYLMTVNDSKTRVDASFCGVFDGKGHTVTIDCDRHAEKYGDGQSVGLIGLIGVHDNDDSSLRPSGAAVRNVAVYGSIRANRSVGGIVGKIGKSDGGVTIENCANFASITGTDSKGTGGICGAAWNGGEIRNCYNAGDVTNTGKDAVAGIAGSNEVDLLNCYNVGAVTGPTGSTTASIASENGGGTYTNCYWLAGTADMGVYNKTSDQIVEKTADEMKAANFVAQLNGEDGTAFAADSKKINSGYPILSWQSSGSNSGGNGGGTVTPDDPTTKLPFTDVSTSHWAYDAICYVYEKTLFNGMSATRFGPDEAMTRAMLWTVLARADHPTTAGGSNGSNWYERSQAWVMNEGISDGTEPDAQITREQLVTMLWRYKKQPEAQKALSGYTDIASISDYAKTAMAWAVESGLLKGNPDGTLNPAGTATRAELATILMRFQQANQK